MSIKQQRASLGTTHTQRKSKREEGAAAARGCCARRALFRTQNQTRNAAPPEFAKAADFVVVQSQRVRSNILLRAHTAPRAFFSARRRAAFSAQCARVLACVWRCPGQQRVFFLQRCAAAQLCSLIKHLQDPKMQALKKSCCLSFSRRRPLLMPCRLACATQLGFAPRCCGFQTRGSSQSSRRHLNARVWRRFVSPVGEHKRCSNEQTKHTRNHSYMYYSSTLPTSWQSRRRRRRRPAGRRRARAAARLAERKARQRKLVRAPQRRASSVCARLVDGRSFCLFLREGAVLLVLQAKKGEACVAF